MAQPILPNQQLSYKKNWHVLAQRKSACTRRKIHNEWRFCCLQVSFSTFYWSIMISSVRGSIHQGHEAFSEHSRGRQCAFMSLAALLFNRSNLVDLWTQTNVADILCRGDRMYLHALTNKMVPDANTLSIEELLEVATSQNNVEYCWNYNKFYQGSIDRSFCGDGPFFSLKQVLINAFSDSLNAMLVLDGYVMAVITKSDFLNLFDSHARNSLGIPDENGTAAVLKFSELDEFQNHVETLGHCVNVRILKLHLSICMLMFVQLNYLNKVILMV